MIAVDLGSSYVRAARPGEGVSYTQPSLLARDAKNLKELAGGAEAFELQTDAPGSLQFIRPVRAGRIQDWQGALSLLKAATAHVHNKRGRPRLALAVPADLTLVERNAWQKLGSEAGASEVLLVEIPLCAALGAGCDPQQSAGRMVLDWGGGTVNLGLVYGRQLFAGVSEAGGGLDIDLALQRCVRQQAGLLLSHPEVEAIKHSQLSALPPPDGSPPIEIKGLDAIHNLERSVKLAPGNLQPALEPYLLRLREAIQRIFAAASAEICADLLQEGLLLCGGASRLKDLKEFLERVSGLRVLPVETPEEATIRGLAEWIRSIP